MFAELKKIYDFLSQRNMMQSKQKFKENVHNINERRTKTNDSSLSEIGHLLMPWHFTHAMQLQFQFIISILFGTYLFRHLLGHY